MLSTMHTAARNDPAMVTARQPYLFTNELEIGPENNRRHMTPSWRRDKPCSIITRSHLLSNTSGRILRGICRCMHLISSFASDVPDKNSWSFALYLPCAFMACLGTRKVLPLIHRQNLVVTFNKLNITHRLDVQTRISETNHCESSLLTAQQFQMSFYLKARTQISSLMTSS